ncbi:type II toxin-antitoxin system RelB/DinJ family antitoxin [Acidaminococcus sp.]|uniref:type II toxin-antitoxin system RelB/DinJ family antitoxin n=1 Tax=Acidaminococcus sp. TaxID=1872103 RepID=UPI00351F9927
MASVNVNIRMDADLKKEFEEFCSNVGMNMTTAFTIFARRTVRENRIPFEVSADCRRAAIHQVPVDSTPAQGTATKRPEDMFEEIKQDFNI